MTALPNRNILDGTKLPATTTSEMKTALGSIRDFLSECLGVDSTQQTLINPIVSKMNGGQLAGNRNRITNGACEVAQVGTITASSTMQYGGGDMFMSGIIGATGITGNIIQLTGQSTSSGFAQGLSVVSFTTGKPTFASRIESKNTYDLSTKTVTVSGLFFQNTGSDQPLSVRLGKASALDNFTTVTTLFTDTTQVATDNTYTAFKATFTITAGDASNGLEVSVFTTNNLTAISKTFSLGDLQIEVGSVATPFEQVHIDTIQHQCGRYYREIPVSARWYCPAALAFFDVPVYWQGMRATPTVTQPSVSDGLNYNSQTVVALNANAGRYELQSSAIGDSYALTGVVKLSARL